MKAALACGTDPDLFFSDSPLDVERAKALCRECPARVACLEGALANREPWGVWGGQLFLRGTVVPDKRSPGRPGATAESDHAAAQQLFGVIDAQALQTNIRPNQRSWTAAKTTIDAACVEAGLTPLPGATFNRALGILVRAGRLDVLPSRPRTYFVSASDPSDAQEAAGF